MKTFEQITVRGHPFPASLPLAADQMIAIFRSHGADFVKDGMVLLYRGHFERERLENVRNAIEAHGLSANATRVVWSEYDDEDYKVAALCLLGGKPEIWIDSIDVTLTCTKCGRKRSHIKPDMQVDRVETDKPIVSVNGQFTIVRDDVARRISNELRGARMPPFDTEGRYRYLLPERSLGKLIVGADNAIEPNGSCASCGTPLFETLLGPWTYSRSEYHGEDIVGCEVLDGNAYSRRAFDFFKAVERRIVRGDIVDLR